MTTALYAMFGILLFGLLVGIHEFGPFDAAAGAVEAIPFTAHPDLETILSADEAARVYVKEKY